MQRVLDIDLDFFLNGLCPLAKEGERPSLLGHEPWSPEQLADYLEGHLLLSSARPTPGRVFSTHDGALLWWRELIKAGRLSPPFHVTHVDAHSDLGIGKPGPGFVLYNVLAKHPSQRLSLEEFYKTRQLDEANYLLFALAARIIGRLEDVQCAFSQEDIPGQILHSDQKHICLPQSFPQLFEKQNGAEPVIPFYRTKDPEGFYASEPYDFVSLALSPRYAPMEAEALIPVFKRYMLL